MGRGSIPAERDSTQSGRRASQPRDESGRDDNAPPSNISLGTRNGTVAPYEGGQNQTL